jgi:hypothetical protein
MISSINELSFAARNGFDRAVWRAIAILLPVGAGALGTLIYIGQSRTIWGFLFVLWFVVLDFCLIAASLFRQPHPPIWSRVAYCLIALAGGGFGALEPNRWGGAIPILTMLVAVLVALILEQLFGMARNVVRFISRV